MADLNEIVARLRDMGIQCCDLAADAIEAQQAEIAALTARAEAAEAKVARLVDAAKTAERQVRNAKTIAGMYTLQDALREIGGGNG